MNNTPLLRNALMLDAAVSGAAAVLMIAGAPLLEPLLQLPRPLLIGAGLVLVPYVALLVALSRRPTVSRLMLIDVIGLNVLWSAASIGLLFTGWVEPSALGYAFVIIQAAAVALFAEIQFIAMRRADVMAGG